MTPLLLLAINSLLLSHPVTGFAKNKQRCRTSTSVGGRKFKGVIVLRHRCGPPAHRYDHPTRPMRRKTISLSLSSSSSNGNSSNEKSPYSNILTSSDPLVLRQQAETLRAEADEMRIQLQQSKEEAERRRIARVDAMIQDILVNITIDENNEILNTEEQVARLMQEGRLNADNVNAMFDRIVQQSQRRQSIDNCSPLISLLLDAACMVDCMEREANPNKRWNHRVERDLRKKLFALGWGIDIDEVRREDGVRSITGEKDVF